MSSSSGGTTLGRPDVNPQQIQKLLDENAQLIKALVEAQNIKGKSMDVIQYQQILHRNLVYLAGLADPRVDVHQILPPPGSSNLLQSQRAPPPNQTVSSAPQNMTPPPPSMTTAPASLPSADPGGPPNTMGGPPPPPQWSGPAPSMSQQQQHLGQYNMKGYVPSPWLSQSPSGNYSQQRMQMDRRQLLRLHQERLIRAQQARQMQQVTSQSGGVSLPPQPGMYPGQQGGNMFMGGSPQGGPPMGGGGLPPSSMYGPGMSSMQAPPPSNMPQLDM